MEISPHWRRLLVTLALIGAFLFRLAFGLCADFWGGTNDVKQIYLIGLKFYATGEWPYFGPDVTSNVQIPGALQGLVVGLPFHLLPIPEAPYIVLNILSFASLCFFAWYCSKRLPALRGWVIWSWLLTAPWTLGFSTQVINPSYVLPAAILFFVAALETYPFLSRNLLSLRWANFTMGLTLFWIMQFHLSWVILVPYALLSFYFECQTERLKAVRLFMWFACGAIVTGSFLLPTFINYGLSEALGPISSTVQFNAGNLLNNLNVVEGILGRFLSFASYELPRFIGDRTAARLDFLKHNLWLVPLVIFLALVGLFQPVALLLLWFRKRHTQDDWKAVKYFTLATVVLLYLSFLFSIKAPSSHTFYLTLPVAMLYSLYCWSEFLTKTRWQRFAMTVIICGIIFNVGLAINNYSKTSLYVERSRIRQAIDAKDFGIVGERRAGAKY